MASTPTAEAASVRRTVLWVVRRAVRWFVMVFAFPAVGGVPVLVAGYPNQGFPPPRDHTETLVTPNPFSTVSRAVSAVQST